MPKQPGVVFEIISKLNQRIRLTQTYWEFIIAQKHPSVMGCERKMELVLLEPDQIRRSTKDGAVYLYYKKIHLKYLCVVARHGIRDGFVITCYWTDKIKEGERIWLR